MKPEHADEHLHVASHVTPSHALRVGHSPFYFNDDAVNCAALDNLINFTGKVRVLMDYKKLCLEWTSIIYKNHVEVCKELLLATIQYSFTL